MERRGRGFRYSEGPRLQTSSGFSSVEMQELGMSSSDKRDRGKPPQPSSSCSYTSSTGSSVAQPCRSSFEGARGQGRGGSSGEGYGRGGGGGRGRGRGRGRGGRGRGERTGSQSEEHGKGQGQANRGPRSLGFRERRFSVESVIVPDRNQGQSSASISESLPKNDSWEEQHGYHNKQEVSSSKSFSSLFKTPASQDESCGATPQTSLQEAERELSVSRGKDFRKLIGTKGRPVLIKANFFSIKNFCMEKAFHYDITCNPERPKKLLWIALEEFKLKYFPRNIIAFDGKKNVYTMTPLPCDEKDIIKGMVKVFNEEKQREMEFHVTLKLVACVDLSVINQKCIQVLEVVLRAAVALKYSSVGRSFFSLNDKPIPIMDGLEVRSGMHFSVKQGQQLYVNANTVHKAFLKPQSVVDLIKDLCFTLRMNFDKPLQQSVICKLKDTLRGSKVKYSLITDRISTIITKRVYDVSKTPSELKFNFNGENITVENYFIHTKKVSLKYNHLPCLNLGSSTKSVFVPVEFCTIVKGQVVQHKMSDKQTTEMIHISATDTIDREKIIKEKMNYLDLNNSPQIEEFGMIINPEFEEINARVLDSPRLDYQKSQTVPKSGEWYSKSPFLHGSVLRKWAVLILDECVMAEDVSNFTNQLERQGKEMGVIIEKSHRVISVATRSVQFCKLVSLFISIFSDYKDFDLIFIVGFKNSKIYDSIKIAAELNVGVLTQYLTNSVVTRYKNLTNIIRNVLQKINAKLGGVNHGLSNTVFSKFRNSKVMYVGADVTHPTPGQNDSPSVAAVCASHDIWGFQYKPQIRVQPPREEIIVDMEEIMRQHLRYFEEKRKQKPDVIMFFRDGVGEGQFLAVRDKELTAIQKACRNLDLNYEPKITFLIVQKRHHARFFPMAPRKNENVLPGTVVDHVITKPEDKEFYLVSHASPRGVSRPCRYHCLWDDNNLNADEIQEIAYSQCFTYSRCERSVSYPVPTYYAHHAATRGKLYLGQKDSSNWSNQFLEKNLQIFYKLPPMHFI